MSAGGLVSLGEQTAALLDRHNIPTALIGAAALAAHGYARSTTDLDLATSVDAFGQLAPLAEELRTIQGVDAEFNEPDADDPLGGVLNVRTSDGGLVQVVNFENPFHRGSGALAEDAIRSAAPLAGSQTLRVVGAEHLILLKLYAGGAKSWSDAIELLRRAAHVDRPRLDALARRFGLASELGKLLRAADPAP